MASWHAPNASGDGVQVKMAAFEAMARWLAEARRPVVIGADLNTWADDVDLTVADPEHAYFHEHVFVGLDPPHGLRDAYRQVLLTDGTLETIRRQRPEGPLAVSHVLSDGAQHRMDRIYASDDLAVTSGGYDYETALLGGSDHALHWIDFE